MANNNCEVGLHKTKVYWISTKMFIVMISNISIYVYHFVCVYCIYMFTSMLYQVKLL